jgi:hypothetical protein
VSGPEDGSVRVKHRQDLRHVLVRAHRVEKALVVLGHAVQELHRPRADEHLEGLVAQHDCRRFELRQPRRLVLRREHGRGLAVLAQRVDQRLVEVDHKHQLVRRLLQPVAAHRVRPWRLHEFGRERPGHGPLHH